jgi:hypothetical protein
LETAKTRGLVKSAAAALPKGFDPFQVGRTIAASVGPRYTSIMDFEKRKRDQGEPYAIQAKITLTPAKAKLNTNETRSINILMVDCDGVNLKDRTLTLTVNGGTLKNTSVKTDNQRKATVEFTAGSQSTIATVRTDYPFQKPTGYTDAAEVEPASIQINKPSTVWYVTGTYQRGNHSELTRVDPYERKMTSGRDNTRVKCNAWVTNINPLAGQFTSTPLNVNQIIYIGSYEESFFEHDHFEISAGNVNAMSDDRVIYVAKASGAKMPKENPQC